MNEVQSGRSAWSTIPSCPKGASRRDIVDVFIIGAGPAGLTAAYCLTKKTPSVLVVEEDPEYVGGLCRTIKHNGFLFDIGGHRFFSIERDHRALA